jgi:hypothetical protein
MHITGSIPNHIARAYGITPKPSAAPVSRTAPVTSPQLTGNVTPAPATERIQNLIGARVSGGIDFAAASTPTRPGGAYQLYTRAADKIEAATAIQIGRSLDVTG